jgi:hypothetical protein
MQGFSLAGHKPDSSTRESSGRPIWLNHPVSRRSAIPRKAAKRRARDAPVMHGLRCRCQERQRHPLTPDPAAHGASWITQVGWLGSSRTYGRTRFGEAGASSMPAPDDRVSSNEAARSVSAQTPAFTRNEVVTASKRQRRQRGDQSLLFQDRVVSSSRSSASSVASPSGEMWRAASLAMAQRLWLTTSTLCPSGSRTKAP